MLVSLLPICPSNFESVVLMNAGSHAIDAYIVLTTHLVYDAANFYYPESA
jgi:hypothetical protein